MYDCEICGKKTDSLYIIDVEGAELTTCMKCADGKNIIETIEDETQGKPKNTPAKKEEPLFDIVDNYGEVIKVAREKVGIPLKVLAEMINEKESVLNRIEHQKMLPNDKVVEKLEKNLGIKLKVEVTDTKNFEKKDPDEPITLGDAAFRK
ncbi:MAG: multiprotein bridging factor aMBF1 [Candidatus Micrarchaeia archaeon]